MIPLGEWARRSLPTVAAVWVIQMAVLFAWPGSDMPLPLVLVVIAVGATVCWHIGQRAQRSWQRDMATRGSR